MAYKNGDKVKVSGIRQPGLVVGVHFNNTYIIHWSRLPYDENRKCFCEWNAMVVYESCLEPYIVDISPQTTNNDYDLYYDEGYIWDEN